MPQLFENRVSFRLQVERDGASPNLAGPFGTVSLCYWGKLTDDEAESGFEPL